MRNADLEALGRMVGRRRAHEQAGHRPVASSTGLYRDGADPWSFETSAYEARKRAVTLASLPHGRYRRAFEPGCSIGTLTEQLADRCDRLLAADVSERAVARNRARLGGARRACVSSGSRCRSAGRTGRST